MFENNKAFTILELITAIAIIGILSSLAIPAFDTQVKNSRLVSNANLIVGAYNMARSEAINSGLDVKVESIPGGGWAVKEVVSGNVLNQFEPNSTGITWEPATFVEVTYLPNGFRPFGANTQQTIRLCDDRNIGRLITITPSGSTKVEDAVCT